MRLPKVLYQSTVFNSQLFPFFFSKNLPNLQEKKFVWRNVGLSNANIGENSIAPRMLGMLNVFFGMLCLWWCYIRNLKRKNAAPIQRPLLGPKTSIILPPNFSMQFWMEKTCTKDMPLESCIQIPSAFSFVLGDKEQERQESKESVNPSKL